MNRILILFTGLSLPASLVSAEILSTFSGAGSTQRFNAFIQRGFSRDSLNSGVGDFGAIGGTASGTGCVVFSGLTDCWNRDLNSLRADDPGGTTSNAPVAIDFPSTHKMFILNVLFS